MFQSKIQSHELTMFGSFRYSTRKGGGEVTKGRELLTDELDAIIETDEELEKYGSNTEFDSEDFCQELFGRVYGDADKVKDNEWAAAHQALDELDEFRQLKSVCANDPDLSAMATAHILQSMSEQIAETVKEYRAYAEDPDSPQDENGQPDPKGFQLSGDTKEAIRSHSQSLEELVKELEDTRDCIDVMGSKDEAPPTDRESEEDRSNLVKELRDKNSVLRRIMKIVGRLHDSIRGLSANSMAEELTDQQITVGRGKVTDLLRSETRHLASDETADIFFDRWIKRSQLKFEKKGKSKKVGGPITVLVDESGSMEGHRQDISKAVSAALFAMAAEQKRDITVIGFDTKITFTMKKKKRDTVCSVQQYHYNPVQMSTFSAIGHLAKRRTLGGTSFEVAIDKALKESRGKNADILFITDGEDQIRQDALNKIIKSKEKDGTRIFTILLGTNNYSLRSVSDAVLPFGRLTDKSINSLASLMKSMER